jgi:hypothetical protein
MSGFLPDRVQHRVLVPDRVRERARSFLNGVGKSAASRRCCADSLLIAFSNERSI